MMNWKKVKDILKLFWCLPIGFTFSSLEHGCMLCIFGRKCPFMDSDKE